MVLQNCGQYKSSIRLLSCLLCTTVQSWNESDSSVGAEWIVGCLMEAFRKSSSYYPCPFIGPLPFFQEESLSSQVGKVRIKDLHLKQNSIFQVLTCEEGDGACGGCEDFSGSYWEEKTVNLKMNSPCTAVLLHTAANSSPSASFPQPLLSAVE